MVIWLLLALWGSWWVNRRLHYRFSAHCKALREDVALLEMCAYTLPEGATRRDKSAHRDRCLDIVGERHPKLIGAHYVLGYALRDHIRGEHLQSLRDAVRSIDGDYHPPGTWPDRDHR